MEALATARRREHDSLIVGHRLRCPRCHTVQDCLAFFVFSKPEEHADELNTVLKCRAKVRNESTGRLDPCRCIFSVGEPIDFSELVKNA